MRFQETFDGQLIQKVQRKRYRWIEKVIHRSQLIKSHVRCDQRRDRIDDLQTAAIACNDLPSHDYSCFLVKYQFQCHFKIIFYFENVRAWNVRVTESTSKP